MSSVEGILDILDPRGQALAKAKALNKNLMSGPDLPNTGSTFQDFLLNALNLAPMGLGAKTPNSVGPSFRLQGGKTDLGVPQVSGAGIAENANIYNPKVNQVLEYLSNSNIPVNQVKDTSGGTTYVKFQSPYGETQAVPRIRIPSDSHIGHFGGKNYHGNEFDLGTVKGNKASNQQFRQQEPQATNISGEFYGENFDALKEAIKTRTSSAPKGESWLTSPDKAPNFNPKRPNKNQESSSLEKPLNMDDLIDSTLKDMERPKNLEHMKYTDDNPFKTNNISKPIKDYPNDNWLNDWKKPSNLNMTDEQITVQRKQEQAQEFKERHSVDIEHYNKIKEAQWEHDQTVNEYNNRIANARENNNPNEAKRLEALKSQYFKQTGNKLHKEYSTLPENLQDMLDNSLSSRHDRMYADQFMERLSNLIDEQTAQRSTNMEQPKFTSKQMVDMTKAMNPPKLLDLSLLKPSNN